MALLGAERTGRRLGCGASDWVCHTSPSPAVTFLPCSCTLSNPSFLILSVLPTIHIQSYWEHPGPARPERALRQRSRKAEELCCSVPVKVMGGPFG